MSPFRKGNGFNPETYSFIDKDGNSSDTDTGSFARKSAIDKLKKANDQATELNKKRGWLQNFFNPDSRINGLNILHEEALKENEQRELEECVEKLADEKILHELALSLSKENQPPWKILHKIGGEIVISGTLNGTEFAVSSTDRSVFGKETINKEKSKYLFKLFNFFSTLDTQDKKGQS